MAPEGVIFTTPMASGLLLGKPRGFHYFTLHFIRQQHLMVFLYMIFKLTKLSYFR
jgi:hypothetical protein